MSSEESEIARGEGIPLTQLHTTMTTQQVNGENGHQLDRDPPNPTSPVANGTQAQQVNGRTSQQPGSPQPFPDSIVALQKVSDMASYKCASCDTVC